MGIEESEVVGKKLSEIFPEFFHMVIDGAVQKVLEGDRSSFEAFNFHGDGSEVMWDAVLSPIFDKNGKVHRFIGIFTDVTEKERADEALKKEKAFTEGALNVLQEIFFVFDVEGRFLRWNNTFKSVTGYSDEEIFIMKPTDFFPQAEKHRVTEAINTVMETGQVKLEAAILIKNGCQIPFEFSGALLKDFDGRLLGISGTGRDITERKQAEDELRGNEEFIRSILDNVGDGFIVVDRNFSIVSANRAYCMQTGAILENVIGKHCFEISHKALRPCYEEGEDCAVKRVFETGEPHTAMHRHKDVDGNLMYVETKAFPMSGPFGAVTSVIETIRNINERHLLETEQLKTQKLEAIGTLAGGIAHDFRNLLQGVFGYISMAKQSVYRNEDTFDMLEQAEKALKMSVNLTSQLLTFSKGGKPAKKKLDLQPIIENSARFAQSGSRSDYRFTVDPELWPVEVDEGQIGQVIQNIVLNATEAMPDGGTIKISAKNVYVCHGDNPLLPDGGKFVSIVIEDSGMGIPEHYMSRIFDPYFTSKQNGSGLGLATSYSIVRNHGGGIDVKSHLGKGSTFSIYLPASEAQEKEKATQSPAPVYARHGKILVMDDDEVVRLVAEKMITSLGHEVTCTEDGETAIEKFRMAWKAGKPFDVVILDLTVKGSMGGEEACTKLREIDPGVKSIVSSGYSDNATVSNYQAYGFAASLNKPYTVEALRDSLNSLLRQL